MGKGKLSVQAILADIRGGMTDQELVSKYGLTPQGLQTLFGKLIKAGMLKQSDLDSRIHKEEPTVQSNQPTQESFSYQTPLVEDAQDSPWYRNPIGIIIIATGCFLVTAAAACLFIIIERHKPVSPPAVAQPSEPIAQDEPEESSESQDEESSSTIPVNSVEAKRLNKRLWRAIEYRYAGDVEDLLREGVDVNVRNEHGATPLILASHKGWDDIVGILIRRGADLEAKTEGVGWTALMLASRENHYETVQRLLFARADIETKNRIGETALMLARANGNTAVVELLESHKAARGETSTFTGDSDPFVEPKEADSSRSEEGVPSSGTGKDFCSQLEEYMDQYEAIWSLHGPELDEKRCPYNDIDCRQRAIIQRVERLKGNYSGEVGRKVERLNRQYATVLREAGSSSNFSAWQRGIVSCYDGTQPSACNMCLALKRQILRLCNE